jgi:predicted dienelactone hydrolase
MMSIIAADAGEAGRERVIPVADMPWLADDFAGFSRWLKANPQALMRELPVVQLPVPRGLDHAGKVAWVDEVAASWGVEAADAEKAADGMSGRRAEKRFGSFLVVAQVGHPDRTYSGLRERAAAHGIRASRQGSPVAA